MGCGFRVQGFGSGVLKGDATCEAVGKWRSKMKSANRQAATESSSSSRNCASRFLDASARPQTPCRRRSSNGM